MAEPTRDQMKALEQLASRMGRDSRWQVTEAAFRLGLRLGAETVLGPRCPCDYGEEPWHQRGICREGERVLMKEIGKS